jgi:hypothetical protein
MKLRLFFFMAFAFLLIHMTTQASTPLRRCSWVGNDTTPFFTNCIDSNFKKIERTVGLDVSSCFNFGTNFSYSYQMCVRKNFRTIDERLKLTLDKCPAIGEEVNAFYVACIQKNFKTIERVLP